MSAVVLSPASERRLKTFTAAARTQSSGNYGARCKCFRCRGGYPWGAITWWRWYKALRDFDGPLRGGIAEVESIARMAKCGVQAFAIWPPMEGVTKPAVSVKKQTPKTARRRTR